ncbi:PQQ-dependent sugar dehydrogenase [Microbacterium sp.]|uniref:PQQ-dependent sugar dehydrogenase n=1 Tax=Microbacterium sp. TaxID=51671 RepID=UPI003C70C32D
MKPNGNVTGTSIAFAGESAYAPFLASAVLAALTLTSCTGSGGDPTASTAPLSSSHAPSSSQAQATRGTVEVVADGLDIPWSVVFHDDTALISERDSARVLELTTDGTIREVGVVPGVAPAGEAGLLGLAVRGDDLYVYSTGQDENRIQRFALTGEPGSFGLGPAETVLDGLPKANWHSGGRIAFGPDGMLYATVGDTYRRDSAQDLDALSGKILRMTPDGEIPGDNPFDGSYVYSYGHRNPQGIAWDADGTMYSAEFGEDTWDELNVIEPGGNYGWPLVEGAADDDRFIDPVQQWPPAEASPSGIAVAGDAIWIANLRGERLREVPLDDLRTATEHLVGQYGRLRLVTPALGGSLWVLTNDTGDDRILRYSPAP